MCRESKYFQLQSRESATPEEFEQYLKGQQAKLEEHRRTSNTGALYIAKYPRAKRHLMYVFEGLSSGDDGLVIPLHFFRFKEFRPAKVDVGPTQTGDLAPPQASASSVRSEPPSRGTSVRTAPNL